MAESQRLAHVLVIPYPAQGHMLSLLDLAHLLSARHRLAVTVVVTPGNLPLLSPLLSCFPAISSLVLPFPDYPSIPSGLENTKDLARHQFRLLSPALAGHHAPIVRWARAHPEPPDVLLSDLFLGWTTSLAAELGIPRLVFSPSGAFVVAVAHWLWRRMPQRSDLEDPDELFAFPSIPRSPLFRWRELSALWRSYRQGDPISEFTKEGMVANTQSWGLVLNTFSELERPFLDYLRDVDLGHHRVWAVGPLLSGNAAAERGGPSSVAVAEVMEWLDRCETDSVVYVAFGSQAVLSPPQAAAVAAGLEKSGSRFVWAGRGDVAVPEEFEERVAGRGLLIRGWAPQVAILNHPAVGAFVTHCGWNSVMEAMSAGVVMLTWPLGADQFMNAQLVEEAGVGVRVCSGGEGVVPHPEELARAVGEAGRGRRERAKALAAKTREATMEGGSSHWELEEMVEEVSKLVLK